MSNLGEKALRDMPPKDEGKPRVESEPKADWAYLSKSSSMRKREEKPGAFILVLLWRGAKRDMLLVFDERVGVVVVIVRRWWWWIDWWVSRRNVSVDGFVIAVLQVRIGLIYVFFLSV